MPMPRCWPPGEWEAANREARLAQGSHWMPAAGRLCLRRRVDVGLSESHFDRCPPSRPSHVLPRRASDVGALRHRH